MPGSDSTEPDFRAEILATFKEDRAVAHRVAFAHRHPNESPAFHEALIHDWQSADVHVLHEVFRGGAKSTLAEEGLLLGAAFKEFKYALLVGSNLDKACQRLHAIRYEAETNETLRKLFGELQGPIWSVDQLMFANGVMLQALGKGMSLRGVKHLDMRPDFLMFDDLEDRVDVRTEDRMNDTWRWFNYDLLPAMAQGEYRARGLATPMHPECLPIRLEKEGEFVVRKVPIYHLNDEGERVSSWPDRFPLTIDEAKERAAVVQKRVWSGELPAETKIPRYQDSIEFIENRAHMAGSFRDFQCEYLVTAESPEEKPFKREMIRVEPQFLPWAPVNVMFDPARTIGAKSARTGYAAWSDIGPRCIVWDAWGKFLLPDQIIEAMFQVAGCDPSPGYERLCDGYDCLIHLGVEEDGLNEWLLQPLREQQTRRGVILPIRPLRAPKGKTDFIRSLQPYYNAREIIHNRPLPDLESELLSFPHATRRDVPNALAYRNLMRKGRPIYSDFTPDNVAEDLQAVPGAPYWLALNAGAAITTGVLLQFAGDAMRILDCWVREGEPREEAETLAADARLIAGLQQPLYFVAPPNHFEQYSNVGLKAAVKPADLRRGADPQDYTKGRTRIRDLLQRQIRGMPGVLVSDKARWVTAAFSGGYAHVELKHGALAEYAEEGPYRLLMEGLESLAGAGVVYSTNDDSAHTNAVTRDGRPYRSIIGSAPGRVVRRG